MILFVLIIILLTYNTLIPFNLFRGGEYILEIKHALSCLLQNNLRGGEMLFEIEKPRR